MHQRIRKTVLAGMIAGFAAFAVSVGAQTPTDNSKVNARDRGKSEVTADQQKENAIDRDLTRKIRRALVQDKTLSSYAHNIKVITANGQVTLKGPVRSEDERHQVETLAVGVAGADRVKNEMSIAPKRK